MRRRTDILIVSYWKFHRSQDRINHSAKRTTAHGLPRHQELEKKTLSAFIIYRTEYGTVPVAYFYTLSIPYVFVIILSVWERDVMLT